MFPKLLGSFHDTPDYVEYTQTHTDHTLKRWKVCFCIVYTYETDTDLHWLFVNHRAKTQQQFALTFCDNWWNGYCSIFVSLPMAGSNMFSVYLPRPNVWSAVGYVDLDVLSMFLTSVLTRSLWLRIESQLLSSESHMMLLCFSGKYSIGKLTYHINT